MNLLRPIERDLTVNGLRLHLLDWGGDARPPLLLLHGFTGHAHAWDTLSIALQPPKAETPPEDDAAAYVEAES